MAIITLGEEGGVNKTRYFSWSGLGMEDSGQPAECPSYMDKTMQVFGTFGATVTMQGSNDPRVKSNPGSAVWFTLVDPHERNVSFTAAGAEVLLENPRFIRPLVTGGDSFTDITVIICARKG